MERFSEEYMPSSEWLDAKDEYAEFEIKTAQQADWAISKIAEERARAEFFINCAKEEKARLDNQIKDAEKKLENATSFLTGKLGQFLEKEEVPKKETKTQISVTLPAGKIVTFLTDVLLVTESSLWQSETISSSMTSLWRLSTRTRQTSMRLSSHQPFHRRLMNHSSNRQKKLFGATLKRSWQ